MTSKYAVQFAVPEQFPELLKEFTREVLRAVTYEQITGSEEEIYAFAVQHFARVAKQQNARFNRRKLTQAAMNMFRNADVDGSGDLDFAEVREIFSSLASELNLANKRQVDEITENVMRAADENADGRLNYEEFAPLAIDIIESLYHKFMRKQNEAAEANAVSEEQIFDERARLEAARLKAEGALVREMDQGQLSQMIMNIFEAADTDRSGYLNRRQFKQCLKESQLGLSDEEMDYIMTNVDVDHDGKINFEEFAPMCYEMLVQLTARQFLADEDARNASVVSRAKAERLLTSMSKTEVSNTLLSMFEAADSDHNGYLDPTEVVVALQKMELGLTNSDIKEILEQMNSTADGKLRYKDFAPLAYELLTMQLQKRILEDDDLRSEAERRLFGGKSKEEIQQMVTAVFHAADADQSGALSKEELYSCLVSSGIGFSDAELENIIIAADVNQDGNIDLAEFTPLCYELALEVAVKDLKAARASAEQQAADQKRAQAEQYLTQMFTREQLHAKLLDIFEKADIDGSGALDGTEFARCLQDTSLGFTPDQIAVIVESADQNKDGFINFSEFAPLCFDLLVEMIANQM